MFVVAAVQHERKKGHPEIPEWPTKAILKFIAELEDLIESGGQICAGFPGGGGPVKLSAAEP